MATANPTEKENIHMVDYIDPDQVRRKILVKRRRPVSTLVIHRLMIVIYLFYHSKFPLQILLVEQR